MNQEEKKIEGLDELVRDLTLVVPKPKSLVRRRITELLDQTRANERAKFVKLVEETVDEMMEKRIPWQQGKWMPMDDRNKARNQALSEAKQKLLESLK